jgi:demethylmenaquinone methyltransferase/2-methoxy-6-polyprenyl-1,4-benzoquinol methylase
MTDFDAYPEPGRIRDMFDDIAGSYDRLNDLMTAGLHHRWRELGVLVARVGPGSSVLDACCGTGDFAFALKRAVGRTGRVVAVDVSQKMLEVARDKCGRQPALRGVSGRRCAGAALPGRFCRCSG